VFPFASIGAEMLSVSAALSQFFPKINTTQQPKQIKTILFGSYSWDLIFFSSLLALWTHGFY
jgi:hypothetical protein